MYVTSIKKDLESRSFSNGPISKTILILGQSYKDYREDKIIFVVGYCNATSSDTQKIKMKLTFKNGQSWSISSYFRVKKKEKSKSRKRSTGGITQYSNQFPQENMTKTRNEIH